VAYDFPTNPDQDDTYTSPDGRLTYGWNGFAWDMKAKTAAAQRPDLSSLVPSLAEIGVPDVTITIEGDLFNQNTKVVAVNQTDQSELILSSTFVSLTELTAIIPTSTITTETNFFIYTENDALRSSRQRDFWVVIAPVLDYLDPTELPAGSAVFNLDVYGTFHGSSYSGTSGNRTTGVIWDGVYRATQDIDTSHMRLNAITPDAVPGTVEVTIAVQDPRDLTNLIYAHETPLIFTYT
jgi:hypothetical protein